MPTNIAFSGGVSAVTGWGDRWVIQFNGTWAFGDKWTLDTSFNGTSYLIGEGDVTNAERSGTTPNFCYTYNNRVYLANGNLFNFCDNSDPTGWEEQNPGAGFESYISQQGGQDGVVAFGQLQGQLAVFARYSTQLWAPDADPANFAIQRQLDNAGTQAPLSVQNLGDFDVLFLDSIGVRSLRSIQITQNYYIDDIGAPVDELIQETLIGYDVTKSCAIVEPSTKNYWLHANGVIFVLSRHPSSKVQAWTTYIPTGDDGVAFVPYKFVVFQGLVYCLSTAGHLYIYGGANGNTYDPKSQVTFQTPWLEDKRPGMEKQAKGFSFTQAGKWTITFGMNPKSIPADIISTYGSETTPNSLADSTFDDGLIDAPGKGTHFSIIGQSGNKSTTTPATFSAFIFYYNPGELQ